MRDRWAIVLCRPQDVRLISFVIIVLGAVHRAYIPDIENQVYPCARESPVKFPDMLPPKFIGLGN